MHVLPFLRDIFLMRVILLSIDGTTAEFRIRKLAKFLHYAVLKTDLKIPSCSKAILKTLRIVCRRSNRPSVGRWRCPEGLQKLVNSPPTLTSFKQMICRLVRQSYCTEVIHDHNLLLKNIAWYRALQWASQTRNDVIDRKLMVTFTFLNRYDNVLDNTFRERSNQFSEPFRSTQHCNDVFLSHS